MRKVSLPLSLVRSMSHIGISKLQSSQDVSGRAEQLKSRVLDRYDNLYENLRTSDQTPLDFPREDYSVSALQTASVSTHIN